MEDCLGLFRKVRLTIGELSELMFFHDLPQLPGQDVQIARRMLGLLCAGNGLVGDPVSYTHLTLPTIYSV